MDRFALLRRPARGSTGLLFLLTLLLGTGSAEQAAGQVSLSVTPAYAYLTEEAPHGAFVLRNDGTERAEVLVSARYGVIASDEGGEATHVTLGEAGLLGDLTERLRFFPDRLLIEPGAERIVRFLVPGASRLPRGGHVALMHFQMQERRSTVEDQVPAVATGLSIVYNLVAPVVLLKGEGAAVLSAEVLPAEDGVLRLMLTNRGAFPFVGGITASVERGGEQVTLGRAESAVYTRRRVDIPLSDVPSGGKVLLEFDAHYGSLPLAVSRRLVVPAPIEIDFQR